MKHLVIGITGHRPNRLHVGIPHVSTALTEVFQAIRTGAAEAGTAAEAIHVLSAIAEGTDRLAADVGLALGMRLDVLIPFASADYETTFGDPAAIEPYRALLTQAASVTEQPGTLAEDTAGYEACGRAIMEASDLIVTVWDGKPAAGRGGTPEILDYALARGLGIVWIDAAAARPPLLLRKKFGREPTASSAVATLAELAPHAPTLTAIEIARFVGMIAATKP